MTAKTAIKHQEAIYSQRGQQKRHGQTERIDCQKYDSPEHRFLRPCENQDRCQDRTDAWRPAKSEGKADGKRSQSTRPSFDIVQPLVSVERVDLPNAGQVEAENDDHNARDSR